MSWEEAKANLDADGYEVGEACNRDGCKGVIKTQTIIVRDVQNPNAQTIETYCNTCNWRGEYDK